MSQGFKDGRGLDVVHGRLGLEQGGHSCLVEIPMDGLFDLLGYLIQIKICFIVAVYPKKQALMV